jgi:hypothetical protein
MKKIDCDAAPESGAKIAIKKFKSKNTLAD